MPLPPQLFPQGPVDDAWEAYEDAIRLGDAWAAYTEAAEEKEEPWEAYAAAAEEKEEPRHVQSILTMSSHDSGLETVTLTNPLSPTTHCRTASLAPSDLIGV